MAAIPAPSLVWPSSASALCQILGVDSGPAFKCHGETKKKKRRCKIDIKKDRFRDVERLLRQVAQSGSLSACEAQLGQLAPLLVCTEHHQDQAPGQLAGWKQILKKFAVVKKEDEEDGVKRLLDGLAERADVKKLLAAAAAHNNTTGKATSASATRGDSKPAKLETPETPKKPADKQKHHFTPFHNYTQTTLQTNKKIKAHLLRPLTEEEKNLDGSVYAYTSPDNYRDSSPYLKIGNTKDVNVRMRGWRSKCGYEPKVMMSVRCDNYVKVENLVHKQLHNERKREAAGCPACGVRHQEWFDIRSSRASTIMALWADWTRRQPFDEKGELKPAWRERLDKVDLSRPNCWDDFVNEEWEDDTLAGSETDVGPEGESDSDYSYEYDSDDFDADD